MTFLAHPGSPTLPIRSIRERNLTYVRSDLGSLKELKASIQEHGMLVPVLLRHDLVVLDGTRRLRAAEDSRWATVPVLVASDWSHVHDYFIQLIALQADPMHKRLPMHWAELDELWRDPLKGAVDSTTRKTLMRETRAIYAQYPNAPRRSMTHFNLDLSAMFGLEPVHVKVIRDLYSHLRLGREANAPWMSAFDELIPTAEAIGIETVSSVRRTLREAEIGHWDASHAHKQLSIRLERSRRLQTLAAAKLATDPAVASTRARLQPTAAPTSNQALAALVKMLDEVAGEAKLFVNFNESPESAAQLSRRITLAVRGINQMRRRLEVSSMTSQSLKERA